MADAVPGTRIQPAGRPLDGLPKAAPQGRAERERASSTADPQCVLILEDASTVAAPQCAATTLVKMLLANCPAFVPYPLQAFQHYYAGLRLLHVP